VCGDVLGISLGCAPVPGSEGSFGNYSIAAPRVHLAVHTVSYVRGRPACIALMPGGVGIAGNVFDARAPKNRLRDQR